MIRIPIYWKHLVIRFVTSGIITTTILCMIALISQIIQFFSIFNPFKIGIKYTFIPIVLLIPELIMLVIPISVPLGISFVLFSMINHNEIVAFKASGLIMRKFIGPIIWVGIIFSLISYGITLWLYPIVHREFKIIQRTLQEKYVLSVIKKQRFNKFKDITIYFDNIDSSKIMHHLMILDRTTKDAHFLLLSKTAEFIYDRNSTSIVILMRDVTCYKITSNNNANTIIIDSKTFRIPLGSALGMKKMFDSGSQKLGELNFIQLIQYIHDVKYQISKSLKSENHHLKQKLGKALISFHNRLLWPLYCVLTSMLVSVRIFSTGSTRNNQMYRNILILAIILLMTVCGIFLTNILALTSFWIFAYIIPLIISIYLCKSIDKYDTAI